MDYGYPPLNFEKFKKGTKLSYNAQNKKMLSIKYNIDSEEWIFKSTRKIKELFCKYCVLKSFLQIVPKEDSSTGIMRKYKQVLQTHMAY